MYMFALCYVDYVMLPEMNRQKIMSHIRTYCLAGQAMSFDSTKKHQTLNTHKAFNKDKEEEYDENMEI